MEKEKTNYKENEKNVRIPLIHACLILVLISLFNEVTITGTLLLCSLVLLEYLFADDFLKKMRNTWNVSNHLDFLYVSSNSSFNKTDIRVNKTNNSHTTVNRPILNQEHLKTEIKENKSSKKSEPDFSQKHEIEKIVYPELQIKGKKPNRTPDNLEEDLMKTMDPENKKKTMSILEHMYDCVGRDDYIKHVFCFMTALQEKYKAQFPKEINTLPTAVVAYARAAARAYAQAAAKEDLTEGNIQVQLSKLQRSNHEQYWKIIEHYKEIIPLFSRPYPKK